MVGNCLLELGFLFMWLLLAVISGFGWAVCWFCLRVCRCCGFRIDIADVFGCLLVNVLCCCFGDCAD